MARLVIAPRAIAWGVLAASFALASGIGDVPARTPVTSGAYTILAADFHVHSFPGDGGLLPWDIAIEARRRGLDVIALTNHNSTLSWRLLRRWSPDPEGVIVLPGFELTSAGYHMAAVGVETPVTWRQLPAAAAAAIHAEGGIAIAAHPTAPRRSRWDDAAIDVLDGVEAASSNDAVPDLAVFTRRVMVRRPTMAPIGASDFHYFAPLGVCRTFVFVTERSAAGVLDAVRRGRTVACDPRGETYGAPDLASVVSAECRRLAGVPPVSWNWLEGITTSGAWLALVALVALGARERDGAMSAVTTKRSGTKVAKDHKDH
jgi:predicted metal-dependent phosphoesterase TrpH